MGSLNSAVGAQMSTMMHRVARRVKLAQAASENRFTDAMEKNKNDLVVAQTALKEDQKASESRIAESQKASESRWVAYESRMQAFIAVNNWKFIVYCLSAAVAIFGTIFGGVAALLHWLGIDIVAPRRAVDHVKGSKGGGEGGVPRPAVS